VKSQEAGGENESAYYPENAPQPNEEPRRKRTGYLSAELKNSCKILITPQSGGVLDP